MTTDTYDLLERARQLAHDLYSDRQSGRRAVVLSLIAEIERLSAPAPSVPEQPKHVPFP